MHKFWEQFSRRYDGQDVVEYTLLLAFVVIISAALLIIAGGSTQGIWDLTNNNLNSGIRASS